MGGKPAKQNTALQRAKARLTAECSRREISSGQARQMLIRWLSKDSPLTDRQEKEIEETISSLKKDKYMDDSRFARAFTKDKLRFSKWGPEKILQGLSDAGVDKTIAEQAIKEEEALCFQILSDLLSKKKVELERKQGRKTAEAQKQIELLKEKLSDIDSQSSGYDPQIQKERAAFQRKIYSLKTKIRTSDQQIRSSLMAFSIRKGFPRTQISSALKNLSPDGPNKCYL